MLQQPKNAMSSWQQMMRSYIAKLTEKGMEVYTLTPEERNAF